MNKKRFVFLLLSIITMVSFVSGCIGGGQFGAPTTDSKVTIKGVVALPENTCFIGVCQNPAIQYEVPFPEASIVLVDENGQELDGQTNCAGEYQISGLSGDGYVLYATRGDVRVKKAIAPVTDDGGEANYFTTAQVIIWEVVNAENPGAIKIKDIPTAIPLNIIPEDIFQVVKVALANCKDAQKDQDVIRLVKDFAAANFGTPCVVPCIQPTSAPIPGCRDDAPYAEFGISKVVRLSNDDYKVYFTVPNTVDGNKFNWDFGDGQTSNQRNPLSHTYDKSYQGKTVTINSITFLRWH